MKPLAEQIEVSRNWARRYATIMGDSALTKLTAEELLEHLIAQKQFAWQSPLLGEIRLRLERLETAEATAQAVQNELALTQEFLREAKERLEKCEAGWERESIQHAACLAAAEGGAGADPPKKGDWSWSPAFQAVLDLRKRLEQCELERNNYALQFTIVTKRLEQCGALLRKPDSSVINLVAEAISEQQSCSSCAGAEPTGPHCRACTNEAKVAIKAFCVAARAAVEGK